MKATTRRGDGAAGGLPAVKTKKKRKDGGGFMWGCGSSKSVSVAAGNISKPTATDPAKPSSTTASAAPMKSSPAEDKATSGAPASRDVERAPSVDALLRQLLELERGVRALGVRDREDGGDSGRPQPPPRRHRRSESEVWDGGAYAASGRGRLEEESVAVVTETEDPLREFRRSMAEMVVENGITGGEELRELLQRFLSLNSARHHHLILLAFADVWEELFADSPAGVGHPLPLPNTSSKLQKPLRPLQHQIERAR